MECDGSGVGSRVQCWWHGIWSATAVAWDLECNDGGVRSRVQRWWHEIACATPCATAVACATYELGRQSANTKLSSNKTVRRIRVRGGNVKWRALRLDTGNYSWGSEAVTRKTRILDVVYNASNNELVRTQTLVKSAIVQVDAAPFKQWYLQHYGVDIGRKKKGPAKKETTEEGNEGAAVEETKKSNHVQRKLEKRQKDRKLDSHLEEQFGSGRLMACISSRPGQCGRADGYILEGKELEFYMKKIQRKKGKGAGAAA
nr:40S ribosomal protein S8 [Ipomoea batatas]